jgi:hypothetical protein
MAIRVTGTFMGLVPFTGLMKVTDLATLRGGSVRWGVVKVVYFNQQNLMA